MIDDSLDKFERGELRDSEQLPDIDAESFTLTWDFDGSIPRDERTSSTLGDTVIFSERSEMWLWGDKWSAPEYVESVREKLRV